MDFRPTQNPIRRRLAQALTRFSGMKGRSRILAETTPDERPASSANPSSAGVRSEPPAPDLTALPFSPDSRSFVMKVAGDTMAGRHILDGDVVIIDPVSELHEGDVVAVVLQDRTVLRTLVRHRDLQFLRADNAEHSEYIPAGGVPIRGVMRMLVRGAESAAGLGPGSGSGPARIR